MDNSRFIAQSKPAADRISALAALSPQNPFHTQAFAEFRRHAGAQVWLLGLEKDTQLTCGCPAYLSEGRLKRRLEIQSLANTTGETFWTGLLAFCEQERISELSINTFATAVATPVPELGRRVKHKSRVEYTLALSDTDLDAGIASKHRYSIRRAKKAGLVLRRENNEAAFLAHAQMTTASMNRKKERGEDAAIAMEIDRIKRLVETGPGEIYQAVHDGNVVSSAIVATAEKGGYYYSAGSSPEGLREGASHFLVYEVARALQDDGKELFNLGGTEADHEGLVRFKKRFGAAEVALESCQFALPGGVGNKILSAGEHVVAKTRAALASFAS